MQYKIILSLLAITSFVAAAPAADLEEAKTEVAFLEESYNNATEIERRDGEDKNARCTRDYFGVADGVNVWGGCGAQGWSMEQARREFEGCGALGRPEFMEVKDGFIVEDNSNGKWKGTEFKSCWYASFTLPTRKGHNCMGRAIKSAGGPAMKCQS